MRRRHVRPRTGPQAYVAPAWPAVSLDNADVAAAAATGLDVPGNETPLQKGDAGTPDSGGGVIGLGWLLALAGAWRALRRAAG